MELKNYVAVDLGAESGRVMLGTVSDEKLTLEEVHRFENGPIQEKGALHWNFPALLAEIKTGIRTGGSADRRRISLVSPLTAGEWILDCWMKRGSSWKIPIITGTAAPTACWKRRLRWSASGQFMTGQVSSSCSSIRSINCSRCGSQKIRCSIRQRRCSSRRTYMLIICAESPSPSIHWPARLN